MQKGIFKVLQTSLLSCFGINCREFLMCTENKEMMAEMTAADSLLAICARGRRYRPSARYLTLRCLSQRKHRYI